MIPARKIFFIGFNKCGTRSFHKLLRGAGLRVYHGADEDPLYDRIPFNIKMGNKPLDGFEDYDAYLDSENLSLSFRDLHRDYPNSKFILNTRDLNGWLVSRLNHGDATYVEYLNEFFKKDLAWNEWVELWRSQFLEHEKCVLEYFHGQDEIFLRYDIEKDILAKFQRFTGLHLNGKELPVVGKTTVHAFALEGGRIVKRMENSATP